MRREGLRRSGSSLNPSRKWFAAGPQPTKSTGMLLIPSFSTNISSRSTGHHQALGKRNCGVLCGDQGWRKERNQCRSY